MNHFLNLIIKNNNNNFKKIFLSALPILQLDISQNELNGKKKFFEEKNKLVNNNTDALHIKNFNSNIVASDGKNVGGANLDINLFFNFDNGIPILKNKFFFSNFQNTINNNLLEYNFSWLDFSNNSSVVGSSGFLSFLYINVLGVILFTFLTIEYPLVPVLFVLELLMFIPVLLLYVLTNDSTFMYLICIINATTVEAVGAVGITMTYLMGLQYKEITNKDVLESSILLFYKLFRKTTIKNYSWYFLNIKKSRGFLKKIIKLKKININLILIIIFLFILFFLLLQLKLTFYIETIVKLLNFEKILNFDNNYLNTDLGYLKQNNNLILRNLEIKKYNEQLKLFTIGMYIDYPIYFEKNKNYLNITKKFINDLHFDENKIKNFKIFQEFKIRTNLSSHASPIIIINQENPINSLFIMMVIQNWLSNNFFEKSIMHNELKNLNNLLVKGDTKPAFILKKTINKNKINMLLYEFLQLGLFLKDFKTNTRYLSNIKLNNYLLDKNSFNFYKKFKKKKLMDIYLGKMNNTDDYLLNFIKNNSNNSKKYTKKLINSSIIDLLNFEKITKNTKFIENTFNTKNIKNIKNYTIDSDLVNEFSILFFNKIKLLKNQSILGKKLKTTLIIKNYFNSFINISNFSKFNYKFYIKNNKYYQKYGYTCLNGVVENTQWFNWGKLSQNLLQNFEIKRYLNWIFSIRPFRLENINIILKLKSNYNFEIHNVIYKNKLNILREWGDKSFWLLIQPTSKILPWFEEADHEYKIYDFSELGLFNDSIYLSELIKIDLNKKIKVITELISSPVLQQCDLKTLYYDYHLKKYKNILKNFKNGESSKIDIFDLKLDWDYQNIFENQRQLMYSTFLSKYYEDFIYLKRLKKINQNFPSISPRNNSIYFNDLFESNKNSIYSEQSNEFGFISSDFLSNKKNFDIKINTFGNNWLIFGKILGIFSYLNTLENDFNFNKKIIGTRRINYKNSLINLLDIKKNKKSNNILNVWNRNLNNNFNENNNQLVNTELNDNSEKLNNQNQLKFLKKNLYLNNFDKLTVFSLPNERIFSVWDKEKFDNTQNWKKIIDNRFLLTFKKKLKKRENWLAKSINRPDSEIIKSNSDIYKIMKGLDLKFNWKEQSSKIIQDYSDLSNKILYSKNIDFNKLIIVDDNELLEDIERVVIEKPHTFYGYLWEEYLKQIYGVNLNFLKFNQKIFNSKNHYHLNNSNFLSNNFQKNIEKNLKANNILFGLSKDKEIANTITAQLLTKFGFIRELSELNTASNYWQNNDNYKNTKESRQKYRLPFLLKKKKIFTEIILKKKLSKKSINNIQKFSENPFGFKEENTAIGLKLPYIKRKIWIKNEENYYNYFKIKSNYSWLSEKNNNNNFTNRFKLLSSFAGISTEKSITSLSNFWRNSNLQSTDYFNLFDFDSNIIDNDYFWGNYLQNSSNFYRDFDDIGFETMENLSENKRYLYRIKPLDGKIENIIKATKTLTGFSSRKKQLIKKKQINLRLFKKLEIYGGGVLSSSSILKYRNSINFEKDASIDNIKKIRRWKNFGDFHLFKNPIVQHFRNSNQKLNNISITNLKKTIKRKKLILEIFNTNGIISKNYTDLFPNTILLENSMLLGYRNNLDSGKYYKINMYNSERFQSFTTKNEEIFLKLINDIPLIGRFNKIDNIFRLDENGISYFENFNNNVLAYTIKNSWAGISNLNKNPSTNYERFFNLNFEKNQFFFKNIIKFKKIPKNKNILKIGKEIMNNNFIIFYKFKFLDLILNINKTNKIKLLIIPIKNLIIFIQKLTKFYLIFKIKNTEKIKIVNNFFRIITYPLNLKIKNFDLIQTLLYIFYKIIFKNF